MAKQPIEFMFSPYRRELLATLFLHPDEQFHVRELERMTGISAGSLHRELRAMAESGLLLREKVGNLVFYRPDTGCPIYEELAAIFRKTLGLVALLRDALAELSDGIEFAFVFGSMASGEQKAGSDVDICVLGDVSLLDVVKALSSVQETLRRDMNPVVMTVKKFLRQSAKRDRFVTRLMSETKLFVTGNEDELAALVENRAAGRKRANAGSVPAH
jgi:predicted nucleotidyltransferase